MTHALRESVEALVHESVEALRSASIVARCVGVRRGGIARLFLSRVYFVGVDVGVMQTFIHVLLRHTRALWSRCVARRRQVG